ncbi:MAG: hypothetical protein R2940_07995 [Syntrophotaleaceae bacterium]
MTRVSKKLFCLLFFLTMPIFCGCVQLERPYPEKTNFVLSTERKTPPGESSGNTVLLVRNFNNSARIKTRSFVYRVGDLEYRSDFYNEFFGSPSDLVTEETTQWLRESGIFGLVTEDAEPQPTHLLRGRIEALHGDYRPGQPPAAVLELQLTLIDDTSSIALTVLNETYRRKIPVGERSPKALVQGWNTALEDILADFEQDAREALAKGARTGPDQTHSAP